MLQLKIPDLKDHQVLVSRVEQLLLPSKIRVTSETVKPILVDGKTTVTGTEAIHEHLDHLESVLAQWYACSCEMEL